MSRLGDIAYITKLAGFEHTEYIQGNCSHKRDELYSIPLFIGKTVRDGFIDNNYDWYISKKLSDSLERSQLRKQCIVLPYVGSVGDLAVFEHDEDCHLGSNIAKIELYDNCGYDIYFIYYFIKSPYGQKLLFRDIQGAVQKNITMEAIRNIELPNIDTNSQKEIVDILKSIDDKILNNNKIIFELESIVKTLYDYWFLQFDFPDENGKPYKTSGGKMVWNDELKKEIPEKWKVENLMETSLCEDVKVGVEKFETKNYLPTANIEGEKITDGEYITFENRESRANMQPTELSVWFAKMKNSVKHLSIPANSKWFIDKYILSTGFQGLKCNKNSFSYIHSIINSKWFEKYKDNLSHGATQESVNNEDLKNIKFSIPAEDILKKYSEIVNPILEKKFYIIQENQELTSLRDFLLPLFMNGQIAVK